MNKITSRYFRAGAALFIFSFFIQNSLAQAPGNPDVDAGPDVTIGCEVGGCTDITATFVDIGETDTYIVESIDYNPPFPFNGLANSLNPNSDDQWSIVENLPFDFCYFGEIETQFQVGSNGVIRFDVDSNDASNDWSFSADLPNNVEEALAEANVFTPGHDIDPSVSNTEEIGYEVIGSAPNRVLVVAYFEVPMFSGACNDLLATQMVVFYETTNIIDIYIQDKPSCPTWNAGNAALGIQNDDGDIAFVPPGRNTSDSPWETTNEAWRFIPAGDSVVDFSWLDSTGTVIGTDTTLNVCPAETEIFTAQVVYTNCNGDTITVTDDVEVTVEGDVTMQLPEDQAFCDTPEFEIIPIVTGDVSEATYLWSTGETTPTIIVSTTDTYTLELMVAGCTIMDEIEVLFLESPDCTITPVCSDITFEENFGTGTGRVCIDPAIATTTYLCNETTQVNDGEYSITNISDGLNTGWHQGMEDHTEGDTDGRMLFVNADFNPGEFYRRTIALSAQTDFAFNAWITTVYDTNTGICGGTGIPSNVIFRIESTAGDLIAETNTGDIQNEENPNWQEFSIDFNTAANTEVQLVLINNAPGGCGNDLAIDDITLTLINGQPVLVTPPDIAVCDEGGDGVEVFDLETQIPIILDGQDPGNFDISFHRSLFDAEANVNPIVVPSAYSNITSPETIFVRVQNTGEASCFNTVFFDLIVNPEVAFTTNLETEIALCSNDEFPTLDATATNDGIDLSLVLYSWVDDSTGGVVSTEAIYTPSMEGSYTVTLTLAPCSEDSFTVVITSTELPTLDLGDDQALCDGGEYEIIPTISGDTTGIEYLWSTGETTPTIFVTESGTYDLEISLGPCVVSDSVTITIQDPLEVQLVEDFNICPNITQTITAVTSETDVTFEWRLNGETLEGETSNTLDIIFTGNEVGSQRYTVIMRKDGCKTKDAVYVKLYRNENCVISQGLSPGGSFGQNDRLDLEFLADRSGISLFQVFNRHGLIVYEKANYVRQWKGQTNDNRSLPTGTYYYVINFENEDPAFGSQKTGWVYINLDSN